MNKSSNKHVFFLCISRNWHVPFLRPCQACFTWRKPFSDQQQKQYVLNIYHTKTPVWKTHTVQRLEQHLKNSCPKNNWVIVEMEQEGNDEGLSSTVKWMEGIFRLSFPKAIWACRHYTDFTLERAIVYGSTYRKSRHYFQAFSPESGRRSHAKRGMENEITAR